MPDPGSSPLVTILTAVLAFGGGLVSSFLMLRGQKLNASVQQSVANTEQVEMIFTGYSQMVEDLQNEVERLKGVIDILRQEQEACEARNERLHHELIELRTRISLLEDRKG